MLLDLENRSLQHSLARLTLLTLIFVLNPPAHAEDLNCDKTPSPSCRMAAQALCKRVDSKPKIDLSKNSYKDRLQELKQSPQFDSLFQRCIQTELSVDNWAKLTATSKRLKKDKDLHPSETMLRRYQQRIFSAIKLSETPDLKLSDIRELKSQTSNGNVDPDLPKKLIDPFLEPFLIIDWSITSCCGESRGLLHPTVIHSLTSGITKTDIRPQISASLSQAYALAQKDWVEIKSIVESRDESQPAAGLKPFQERFLAILGRNKEDHVLEKNWSSKELAELVPTVDWTPYLGSKSKISMEPSDVFKLGHLLAQNGNSLQSDVIQSFRQAGLDFKQEIGKIQTPADLSNTTNPALKLIRIPLTEMCEDDSYRELEGAEIARLLLSPEYNRIFGLWKTEAETAKKHFLEAIESRWSPMSAFDLKGNGQAMTPLFAAVGALDNNPLSKESLDILKEVVTGIEFYGPNPGEKRLRDKSWASNDKLALFVDGNGGSSPAQFLSAPLKIHSPWYVQEKFKANEFRLLRAHIAHHETAHAVEMLAGREGAIGKHYELSSQSTAYLKELFMTCAGSGESDSNHLREDTADFLGIKAMDLLDKSYFSMDAIEGLASYHCNQLDTQGGTHSSGADRLHKVIVNSDRLIEAIGCTPEQSCTPFRFD